MYLDQVRVSTNHEVERSQFGTFPTLIYIPCRSWLASEKPEAAAGHQD